MSKLEDLIPPLELCKQIPEGEFAGSALVWECLATKPDEIWRIAPRIAKGIGGFPAPTLAEILEELEDCDNMVTVWNGVSGWGVQILDFFSTECKAHKDRSPATAALKLYLATIPSTPSIPSEEPSE